MIDKPRASDQLKEERDRAMVATQMAISYLRSERYDDALSIMENLWQLNGWSTGEVDE